MKPTTETIGNEFSAKLGPYRQHVTKLLTQTGFERGSQRTIWSDAVSIRVAHTSVLGLGIPMGPVVN